MNQAVTSFPQHALHTQVARLYRDHHHWLVSWINRRVAEDADAEDLAHNTFVRLLGKTELPELHAPQSYLKTVAGGLVVNFYRRKDIEHAYLDALACQPEAESASPEVIHEHLELLVQISLMLDGLPDKVKQTYLMAQLDGMAYKVIAEQLGVSVSSVKKYMFQATRHCLLFKLKAGFDS